MCVTVTVIDKLVVIIILSLGLAIIIMHLYGVIAQMMLFNLKKGLWQCRSCPDLIESWTYLLQDALIIIQRH